VASENHAAAGTRRLRVALDVTPGIGPAAHRGLGRYLTALVNAADENRHEVIPIQPLGSEGGRLVEFRRLRHRTRMLAEADATLFHAPTAYTCAIPKPSMPTVTSILDLIPLDLPAYSRTKVKARLFHRAASRSDMILTLSDFSASRIVDRLGVSGSQVIVASLPPNPSFTPGGEQFVLPQGAYVAALIDLSSPDPRKRGEWLTDIAEELAKRHLRLVVVGRGTEGLQGRGWVGMGAVSDPRWAEILRGSFALVYTSAYEGLGMPVLEAIACHTPVVAMSNTAIPEALGRAGILVEETSDQSRAVDQLTAALLSLEADRALQIELRVECARQAERFTAEIFRLRVGQAYGQALSPRGQS
jgi:glycosyltransferase involved in cell wall biosynthesis